VKTVQFSCGNVKDFLLEDYERNFLTITANL